MDAEPPALLTHRLLGAAAQPRELVVRESHPLHTAQLRRADTLEAGEPPLGREQLLQLIEEPGIDAGRLRDRLAGEPGDERPLDLEDPLRGGGAECDPQVVRGIARQPIVRERPAHDRSEEHTSELQSLAYLVCRLLLEKKKTNEPVINTCPRNEVNCDTPITQYTGRVQ